MHVKLTVLTASADCLGGDGEWFPSGEVSGGGVSLGNAGAENIGCLGLYKDREPPTSYMYLLNISILGDPWLGHVQVGHRYIAHVVVAALVRINRSGGMSNPNIHRSRVCSLHTYTLYCLLVVVHWFSVTGK